MNRIRVALETQFAHGTPTGLGTYAAGLAAALRQRDDVDLVEVADPRIDIWRFDRRVYWDQVRAARLAARARADVVHFTGGTLPFAAPRPVVLTLHDLVWLNGVNRSRFYVHWYFGRIAAKLAKRADALIADTESARAGLAEALGLDPRAISVAGAGVDPSFFSIERKPDADPFVLAVGTVEERKDLATAMRAVARLDSLRLVAAGPLTPYADVVRRAADRAGASDRLSLLGWVDRATLLDLYARATLLAFPSRDEGFGLPGLQALACGLPVVAARIPVTEEVLGSCVRYCAPGDDAAFATAFAEAVQGGAEVRERVAAGRSRAQSFDWSSVAEKTVAVYRSTIERFRDGSTRRAR